MLSACLFMFIFWQALIPCFVKNEFQESRDNIIHFDVERQTKSQSKKHKKESVEMIKWISFPESQESVSAEMITAVVNCRNLQSNK